ncbi:MAG: tRNA (adenosine(37)-N6)-threonylcarbamoyltransferase complex ATPase subunit type 1 TsaE [Hyphomicrobiales bacterium]|nr:tRNA (adenosine(37)-N6)-threonylcarbamoyltransferase complex ATPase subunit type 1 TsaE [Hyphomicrobiales bacterium]
MVTSRYLNCSETEIEAIARDFAQVAIEGDTITLSGDLGSGKTLFCRAFIRQLLGVNDLEVPSPTYLISIEHKSDGKPPVNHMDLYRISDASELDELGLDEILESSIVMIEWPARAIQALPSIRLDIEIEIVDASTRNLTVMAPVDLAKRYCRSVQIGAFLRNHSNISYTRKPFAADASARTYELVIFEDKFYILMDAPSAPDGPPVKNGLPYSRIAHLAEEVESFVTISKLLRARGFHAPEIYAQDYENGLVLLEYLGSDTIITPDKKPVDARYIESGRLLSKLHAADWVTADQNAGNSIRQIPSFDQSAMLIEVELLTDWYLKDGQHSATKDDIDEFKQIWSQYSAMAQNFRQSIVLRDFHSPNIIWQNKKAGSAQIGLIDFQDALIGPAVYDLVSLAQDARVIVPLQLEKQIIEHYLSDCEANGQMLDKDQFELEYAMMGAQRASKLLGIFVRLHSRDGKSGYRKLIPAIRTYLKKNLEHPFLSDYCMWCERVIRL